ncbi:MRPS35 [Bugula neritina]|uniref:MRPS35 n=1 Tax=Bugula neritina TaxID=10212 RepID=A0A7J7ITS9_BUGNE|nr:MRPS35 [Bugula neritina]
MAASINFVTVSSTLTFWNVSTIFKGCRAPQAVCCIRKFTGNGIPVKPDCTELDKDGFRIYRIPGLHKTKSTAVSRKSEMRPQPVPREKRININTDWTHVWPTAATFKPSVVPLPIRQGYIKNAGENQGLTPGKYHNLELMKVTNFLHLTPRHISKHCAAIKKFCTPWPKALNDSEFRENHFPLSITTQDYVFSGPSIRDPRSRAVTMTQTSVNKNKAIKTCYFISDLFIFSISYCIS